MPNSSPSAASLPAGSHQVLRLATLHTLCTLGWQYLSPAASQAKRSDPASPLLHSSLLHFLRQRHFLHHGQPHRYSSSLIEQIMRELSQECKEGNWQQFNQSWFDKLTAGISVNETMPDGARVGLSVPLIDWTNLKNNQFEVVESFVVSAQYGSLQREIDLVCFVNGIPLCLIAVQGSVASGIASHLRHQDVAEVPLIYAYAQLYLALDHEQAAYGSNQTAPKFWAHWREEHWSDAQMAQFKHASLPPGSGHALFGSLKPALRQSVKNHCEAPLTAADQALIGMLHPQRLLDLVASYMLFDARNGKLVARSHQYFAVKALIAQLEKVDNGRRSGGVVWHTTGSGKSLTMVLLINALRQHPVLQDCRIIVVTDRIDLQDQLTKKFMQSGSFGDALARRAAEKVRAHSAHDLARRISNGHDKIVFTLVHKFNDALLLDQCNNPSDKVIVLVDEAHRSHGGQLHQRMRRVLKRAALVAFTGTPLLKEEKTVRLFGPILHGYSMQRALQDEMVTPLIYEERVPRLEIDSHAFAQWHQNQLQHLLPNLTSAQQGAWQRSLQQKGHWLQADARLELIAWDIALHFHANFKQSHSGLKGMLAANSKLEAIRYHHFLSQTGLINCRIIMSPPDSLDDASDPVANWWREHVGKRQQWYEHNALNQFASEGELDIMIVVDRLLTGFDQPRVAVLYIDKMLQGHSLMQAIARVNRLHHNKTHGMLVDYRGILKPLDVALRAYGELDLAQQYDLDDLQDLYASFGSYCQRLPQLLQQLDQFGDDVASARLTLQSRIDLRQQFLRCWREFDQCLRLALSSRWFFDDPEFSEARLQHYQLRQQFFAELARCVQRDQEAVHGLKPTLQLYPVAPVVRALEVRQERAPYLVDRHWQATAAPNATEPADPLEWSEDKLRIAAESIRFGLQHAISLEMDDDPYAQQVLADLLQRRLAQLHAESAAPLQQYQAMQQLQQQVSQRVVPGLPQALKGQPHASAYYGLFLLALAQKAGDASEAEREAWAAQALNMAAWIGDAILENSLNQAGLEEMIRGRLLRELFVLFGAKALFSVAQLRALLDRLVSLIGVQVWKQSFHDSSQA